MKVRTRFAPSPTGFMHIGNLRTALYSYLYAKHNGGDFILRIEDTDRERYVDGAVEFIYSILKQAGIEHDEGPDKDGGCGPYVQSERKDIYLQYAKELIKKGGAYYCFCDKERLDSLADENGIKTGEEVASAKVTATVQAQDKFKKIIVFKYKAKKNERKKQGHRQPFTQVQIDKITL